MLLDSVLSTCSINHLDLHHDLPISEAFNAHVGARYVSHEMELPRVMSLAKSFVSLRYAYRELGGAGGDIRQEVINSRIINFIYLFTDAPIILYRKLFGPPKRLG